MEHLENDMDDLFQKAGDLYPLKTTASDWDAVAGKLNGEGFGDQAIVPGTNTSTARNRRRWLLLLLLIPVGLGSIIYFSQSKKQSNPSAAIHVKSNDSRKTESSSIKPDIQTEKTKIALINKTEGDKPYTQKESITSVTQKHSEASFSSENHGNKNGFRSNVEVASIAGGESLKNNPSESWASENNLNSLAQTLAIKTLSLSVSETSKIIAVEGNILPSAASDPVKIASLSASSKTNKTPSNKGFYVGFIAGPDLSAVKFQSVKQAGFSLGVLAGYRLSKKFSIETGLLWDKKYYYSIGEYFDKSHTNIPANTKISSVSGNCNMFEIPINLRYDFVTKNNHGFFVKAGISSYLMKRENYSIISLQWPSYPYDSTYKNSINNIFSVLQLSGGYEHSIGAKTNIWIEPYLKIPLQGIGIGNMPISSAGFYIGISYSFR
jgi:hypothetical protein